MYAVIEAAGKQYRVSEGEVLEVDKLAGKVGDTVEFPVLLSSDNGAIDTTQKVAKAEILKFVFAKKIIVFKYKAKKNERKKNGHRQQLTRIKIVSIK